MKGRRYEFLSTQSFYEAWNRLRDAFLAAKNGEEVDIIIKGLLTNDERVKIGRRAEIAALLEIGWGYREIADELRTGMSTVQAVAKKLAEHPECFKLLRERTKKVEKEFTKRAYKKVGGSQLVFKKTKYTGFKRKQVAR
jgi:uncharacterized protein YerC